MLISVEGTFHDGGIVLAETPPGVTEGAKAIVTFVGSATQVSNELRQAALERVLALMEKGVDLGGPPYPSREEIHERR